MPKKHVKIETNVKCAERKFQNLFYLRMTEGNTQLVCYMLELVWLRLVADRSSIKVF